MNFKFILSSLVAAALSTFAMAADNIVVNVDAENAPFMYAKDGKATGIYPALIGAAFKHMNVPVTIDAKPWKRCLQEIDEGTAGVGGIYKNSEREKKYDYSDQIFVETLTIYFNKEKPVNFTKVDDLKGKKVGVLRGWSYGDDFDAARKANAILAEDATTDEQNFQKLNLGRLDAVIAISETGALYMPKFKSIAAAPTALSESPTYLTFSKTNNRTALLKQFDQAIAAMKKSGEFKKLVSAELSK